MPVIPIGDPAPAFSLHDSKGRTHTLARYRGRCVVLYFYPEDDTPLCTAQACQFRDHFPEFSQLDCTVLGISPDGADAHAAFIAGHTLPFELLVDERNDRNEPLISTLYGAWGDKNMYGRIVRAMLRTTYLIAPDGTVAQRWDRVKTPGHAAKVLAAVTSLRGGQVPSPVTPPTPSTAKATSARATPRSRNARAKK